MTEGPLPPRPAAEIAHRTIPATHHSGGAPKSSPTRYAVDAENAPGGAAMVAARTSTIAFDGSAATGELLPGPADLLAAALAACILKNVERFSAMLPFAYERARVHVEVEREEPPPRIARARYTLWVTTDEPERRLELLHRNILRFGTITNTLAAACELSGTIHAQPPAAAQ
jgi:uncharacterized OsmC-like protein